VQLGRALGAGRVIATASTPEKRELTLRLGADEAVDPAAEGLTDRLLAANGGHGVDVVFEMSGGEVFDASYRALAPFGRIVAYGIATNEANSLSTGSLLRHSRAVVGFYLFHCLQRPAMFSDALADLFARALRGELKTIVGATYPLADAARAQVDMRERRTTGKLLLDPSA
jgi:NADPH2:quinone reductase